MGPLNQVALARTELDGMPVDIVSDSTATERVLELASSGNASLVVTPNADHFLRWQRSARFRELYSMASLVVLDGQPLVWLARLRGHPRAVRVTGVDLFSSACEAAAQRNIPIMIIGGGPGVASRAKVRLEEAYPGLQVALTESPEPYDLLSDAYLDALSSKLREYPTKIVAICLGSPKQEELYAALSSNGDGGVYLGVGAAADFWAGTVARAPLWAQRIGAEWLFRLASEPRRLWRRYLVDDLPIVQYLFRAAWARSGSSGDSRLADRA